ncbi:hypothetical protein PG984_007833 [Apiospora sp. TS-2023a]
MGAALAVNGPEPVAGGLVPGGRDHAGGAARGGLEAPLDPPLLPAAPGVGGPSAVRETLQVVPETAADARGVVHAAVGLDLVPVGEAPGGFAVVLAGGARVGGGGGQGDEQRGGGGGDLHDDGVWTCKTDGSVFICKAFLWWKLY